MSTESTQHKDPFQPLRRFDGEPREFWSALAETVERLARVAAVMIVVRQKGGTEEAPWRVLARAQSARQGDCFPTASVRPLMDQVAETGTAAHLISEREGLSGQWLAGPLESGDPAQDCLLVVFADDPGALMRSLVLQCLGQALSVPESYLLWRRLQEREGDLKETTETLDLLNRLRDMPRFESSGLLVCNDLAKRFGCTQVSLAWKKGDAFRVEAVSHTPRFERKMELVQLMEQLAEEAADQGEDIALPAPEGQQSVTRAHQVYADAIDCGVLTSICLWHEDEVIGVLILQDAPQSYSLQQLRALRVIADQIVEPLRYAHLRTGWLGKRIARAGRDWARRQWNLEHPWIKLSLALLVIALGILIFGGMTYRVEAPFVLRTTEQILIPAPFEGYLEGSLVRTGDVVYAGTTLALLDRSELYLQEVSLLADRSRHASEAERARGRGELAEMRVALAQLEQTEAALALARAQLAAAELRAPFDAVVADDFNTPTRAGAPVRRGDVLLRLARLDALFLEIDLPERSVHEVRLAAPGEFAFASRPDIIFPFSVERIEPMGLAIESGNVFRIRGTIDEETIVDWWRPGMTGVAKIEVERRSFLWILTHRVVDWLRLKLWL